MAVLSIAGCPVTTAPPPSTPPPVTKPTAGPGTPPPRGETDPLLQIATRGDHTCGARKSGGVLCWGKNTYGQLGDGTRTDNPRAVKVAGLGDAIAVATGLDFSCALRRGATVVCWGNDSDGQLGGGRGGTPKAIGLRPAAVAGLRDVVQIAAGDYHACARLRDGSVRCWGSAENGQLGSDSQRVFTTPRVIADVVGTSWLSSGGNHVCVIDQRGKTLCWGRNTEGQLGDGSSGSRVRAVEVAGLVDAVEIASGANHSCARRRTGGVVCWGDNSAGQLSTGAGTDRKRYTPVAVAGLTQVLQLAGGADSTCARMANGRVSCWGSNAEGQLGQPRNVARRNTPAVVRNLADAIDVALGARHACAVRRIGDAVCWGSNEHGALGPHPLAT